MTLQSIQNCVILKPDREPEKIGCIIIPEAYRPTLWSGEVISAGPKCREVKAGHRVLVQIAQAVQHTYQGEEVMFTREDQVLAILKDGNVIPLQKPMTRRDWEAIMKERAA